MGAWDGLRYFIVALPEPSIELFCLFDNLVITYLGFGSMILVCRLNLIFMQILSVVKLGGNLLRKNTVYLYIYPLLILVLGV